MKFETRVADKSLEVFWLKSLHGIGGLCCLMLVLTEIVMLRFLIY